MRTPAVRAYDPSSRSGGRDAETRNAPAERRLLRGGRSRTRMQRAARRRSSRTGPSATFWFWVAVFWFYIAATVVWVGLAIWAFLKPDYVAAGFATAGVLLSWNYARRVKAGWSLEPLFLCQAVAIVFVVYLAAVR